MNRIFVALTFCSILLSATVVYGVDRIHEGQWSVVSVTDTKGMPAMPAGMGTIDKDMDTPGGHMHMSGTPSHMTITATSCITEKNSLPGVKVPPGCQAPTSQNDGGKISFKMVCDLQQVKIVSEGSFNYNGDSMQGQVISHESVNGMNIDTSTAITGKYLGPCQ